MKKISFLFFLVVFLLVFLKSIFALTFTEIMYNPYGNEANREWIELFNYNNETINLTNWKIQDGTTIRNILLYNSTYNNSYLIKPYSFVILARNPNNFTSEYTLNYSNINIFQSTFSLTNSGKELILYDNNNNIVDSVFYGNLADEGYTLELKNITSDNYIMENWQQGDYLGSPGILPFEIFFNNENIDLYSNSSNTQDNNQTNNQTNQSNNQSEQTQDSNQENYNQVPEFSTYGIILALTFSIALFFRNRKD